MILPPQAQAIWVAGKLWFLLGAAAILIGLGFFAGFRWQKGEVESAKRARDNQATVAAQWKDRAEGFELAVNRFTAAQAANEKQAKAQREQAARILADLAKGKETAERRAQEWRDRYNAAKRDPDCAKLIEATKCPAFTSY